MEEANMRSGGFQPPMTGGWRPPLRDCLLLVGRGSRDESATAEMHEFARLRQLELQGIEVAVAFLAMARPLLPEQLQQAACQAYRRVIVQPHLLFRGELVESIEQQVAEMVVRHPEKQWIVTPPLADEPGIVTFATEFLQKVILDRCGQAGIHVAALTRGD
jgi:sirohydrochlorin ferrochelatase